MSGWNDERSRILADLESQLQRRMGTSALRKARDIQRASQLTRIPTGLPDLDKLLVGGVPVGHVTEIIGYDTSGMTTIAMRLLAMGQKAHGVGAYIELTPGFHADFAARCGVDVEQLLLARPQTRDDAFDLAGELVARYGLTVLVIDLTLDTFQKRFNQLFAPATVPRFAALVHASTCAVICLSQVTKKQAPFTPIQEITSVRLLLEHVRWIKQYGMVRGHISKASLIRNKLGPIDRETSFTINYPRKLG